MNKNNIIANVKSGFFISLIALPLCLGIAIASSFPPIAGIITAIVGGLIVSLFGGCDLSIKGPAAGLIVIVLASVTDLGAGDLLAGYRKTLAVGSLAALIQIVFALLRTARFGRLMPPSVIHGMLAAIGIIIFAKQIHILVGVNPHGKEPLELILEIPRSIANINPELAFIGIFTLCFLVLIPFIKSSTIKSVPPALLALTIVVPLALIWHLDNPHTYSFLDQQFKVGPEFLVNIPHGILSFFTFPDFSVLLTPVAYKYVLMFALVGSIESVLTVIALDSITKKKSNLDRDLLGVGVGNLICSLIGGLPMISEVVRSKANVDNGAIDRWSNFFHGAFLLLAISLVAPIIREIPLAALAAMLLLVGMRLASPTQFKHTYDLGIDQLALFVTTLVITVTVDLLTGVCLGTILKIVIHLIRGVKLNQLFSASFAWEKNGKLAKLIIKGPAIFTNYNSIQKQIFENLPTSEQIEIDFREASLIDHTTLNCLQSLKDEAGFNKIKISGLENLNRLSKHQLSTHRYA